MNKTERLALLINRLTALGFTLSEIQRLRRIEGTLRRWSEAECNGEIERDEADDNKPYRCNHNVGPLSFDPYPIPDREASALKRLEAIVFARNARARGVDETLTANPFMQTPDDRDVIAYHQTDPRGCSLYLVARKELKTDVNQIVEKARSWGAHIWNVNSVTAPAFAVKGGPAQSEDLPGTFDTEEAAAIAYLNQRGASIPARDMLPIDQHYTRGVAVCA